jgi:hypothetical protein
MSRNVLQKTISIKKANRNVDSLFLCWLFKNTIAVSKQKRSCHVKTKTLLSFRKKNALVTSSGSRDETSPLLPDNHPLRNHKIFAVDFNDIQTLCLFAKIKLKL